MANIPHFVNVFNDALDRVRMAARAEIGPNIDLDRVEVEPPRDPNHGDIATNAAMVLAKAARRNPLELAKAIANILKTDETIANTQVAAPGFVNIKMNSRVWTQELRRAISAGLDYGRNNLGRGEAVNVEYVSANPTGPMHVGHGRGAVFGDALASLLEFTGYKVTREYYVNDAGAQVDVLARSAYLRYREALGEDIGEIPEGLYPGDYLKPVGAALAREFGASLKEKPEAQRLSIVRAIAVNLMMAMIRADLRSLNITHEKFFYESELFKDGHDKVADVIDALRRQGFVYEGRLPPPKGAPVEDWEDREQTLFRSTELDDDIDRPLKKSDGSYTYFATDIAYHKDKIDRDFTRLIDIWGADHAGYIKRMKAAVKALARISNKAADFEAKIVPDVKVIQLVKLLRGGEPVKMSKRAGEFVTLREVVDELDREAGHEVGRDAVRFMMLFRKNDAVLEFDLAKVLEQSRDNPVFYVQYGHARAQSIFRNARAAFPDLPADTTELVEAANLERLSDPAELALMRRIALYPRIVEAAAAAHEPHRIAFYLFDLASEFHALYTLGNASPHLRFIIQDDRQQTEARLVLVQGVATVLASGLTLLGVAAPDEMR
jgi:arginyl-tRNA synthetase